MTAIFNRAAGRALFGAMFTILLGSCALVYDYSDYVACRGNESVGNGLGSAKWITVFGSTFSASADTAHSVAVSSTGDIYLAAEFEGGVTIAGKTLTDTDVYALALAKLDRLGMATWGIKLGERKPGVPDADKGQQFVAKLAIDNMARPIVGGTFDGMLDFGEMSLRPSKGYPDAFLQKRNTDGTFVSGDSYGQQDSQLGYSIAADTNGGTAMTGFFKIALDFQGKCAPLTTTGPFDIFVTKFDNAGECEWSRSYGNAKTNFGAGITFDANNHIAVVGTYSGTLNFGNDAAGKPITLTSNTEGTGVDHFLLELDPKGTPLFAKTFASALVGIFVTADLCGNTFVVENVVVNLGTPIMYSIRVHKFSPEGALAWTQNFTSNGSIEATSIDADATGHLFITGSFSGLADLGSFSITGDAEGDAFVLSLNGSSDGTPLAAISLYGQGNQTATAIRHDPTGGVVVVGKFEQSITTSAGTIMAAIGTDVFVAKFAP